MKSCSGHDTINVLSFSRDLPPKLSGIGFVVENISSVYRDHYGAYDVVATIMDIVPGDLKEDAYDSAHYFFCHGETYNEYVTCVYKTLEVLIQSGKYDLLHFHFDPMFAVPVLAVTEKYRFPLSVMFHDVESVECLSPLIAPNVLKGIAQTRNTTVSKGVQDYLGSLGYNESNLIIIPNGVDTALFKPIKTKIKYDILFFGRLSQEKGLDIVVSVMYNLIQRGINIHGCIIGDGPSRSFVEDMVAQLGITAQVDIIGQVAHDELPYYINASKLVLFPHSLEGMSLTILETLSCGNVAVLPREVSENFPATQGYVAVDDFLSDTALDAYTTLLTDDEARLNREKAARTYVVDTHEWAPIVSQYYAHFASILEDAQGDTCEPP